MLILSLETSYVRPGICVAEDTKIICEYTWKTSDQAAEIVQNINFVLIKTGKHIHLFDRFVVSLGPGSWTGIRMGISLALGLAQTDVAKLYGICSLDAMAYSLIENGLTGVFIPGTPKKYHFSRFENKEELLANGGNFKTAAAGEMMDALEKCAVIAGPDNSILKEAASTGNKKTVELSPSATLNALLASERIKRNLPTSLKPYYEK